MLEPQGKELYVLIPRVSEEQLAGILVSKVVDTVEIEVELEQDASYPPAITGRAIVDGQITLFIDTTALLENAF